MYMHSHHSVTDHSLVKPWQLSAVSNANQARMNDWGFGERSRSIWLFCLYRIWSYLNAFKVVLVFCSLFLFHSRRKRQSCMTTKSSNSIGLAACLPTWVKNCPVSSSCIYLCFIEMVTDCKVHNVVQSIWKEVNKKMGITCPLRHLPSVLGTKGSKTNFHPQLKWAMEEIKIWDTKFAHRLIPWIQPMTSPTPPKRRAASCLKSTAARGGGGSINIQKLQLPPAQRGASCQIKCIHILFQLN